MISLIHHASRVRSQVVIIYTDFLGDIEVNLVKSPEKQFCHWICTSSGQKPHTRISFTHCVYMYL